MKLDTSQMYYTDIVNPWT